MRSRAGNHFFSAGRPWTMLAKARHKPTPAPLFRLRLRLYSTLKHTPSVDTTMATTASSLPAWAIQPTFHRPTPDSQPLFDGETGALRSLSPEKSPAGCAASFARVFELCADRPCIGRRAGPDGPFEWCSYGDFAREVRSVAAALTRQLPAGARVGICAASSYEWVVMDFACLFAGMTSVALSDAWDSATLQAVGQQRGLSAIACDMAAAAKVLDAARSIAEPRAVLLLQPIPPARQLQPAPELTVLQFTELLCEPPLPAPISRDPTAVHTIMHTSVRNKTPFLSRLSTLKKDQFTKTGSGQTQETLQKGGILCLQGTAGLPKGVEYSDSLWLSNMAHFPADLCIAASYQPLVRALESAKTRIFGAI